MHELLLKLKKQNNSKESVNISEQLRFNSDYIDSPLTDEGISQSEQLYENHIKSLQNIKIVLVSPLLRALQTAYHIFKNYKPMPWIVVIPELSEFMNTANDIGNNTLDYKKLIEFKNFDFQAIEEMVKDNQLWNISNLVSSEKKYTIQNILEMRCPLKKQIQNQGPYILVDYLKNNYLETPSDLSKRSIKVRDIINEYSTNYLQKEEEKIAVVSHAKLLQQFIPEKLQNAQMEYWNCCQSTHS
ncbi:histidine phosphatase family (branch protein 1) (macronuclear) [Tetrahymena thermophila SB210]|uniref:Histidine phosphatase family (Branch protein 1) n=1 Tax=Tetrahymena thermophila (strain SB210) TaxID=312017 RepID=I7LVE8_TETTS|nr:histidine phosphatase family (branch protein 1) [Tetrahymena thermophila SB210]EAR97992.2 histidine phosphatase family (branch protein 1) [Tetrahymena thermophila SB210]|eukprot:XP_001018237.2 histidine phosphatase family (branch protein 1) [Tetrahymena thermophila SB210]